VAEDKECKLRCLKAGKAEEKKNKRGYLFDLVLDEQLGCPEGIAREKVLRYCLFTKVYGNFIACTLGVMPFAVHFFHHVRSGGHVFQLIVKEQALRQ